MKPTQFTDEHLQAAYEMDIADAQGQRLGTLPPTEEEALAISTLLANIGPLNVGDCGTAHVSGRPLALDGEPMTPDANSQDNDYRDDSAPFFVAAAYLVERRYGGPEEGGWWYDAGDPIDDDPDLPSPVVTATRDEAYAAMRIMRDTLDATVNVGRREKSSVLSDGVYEAHVSPGYPRSFPEDRPHYE